jgi:hypothetical protein
VRSEHLLQSGFGVDTARVDRKTRAPGRKATFGLRETQLVPDEIHQVRRVFAIVNGESGVEADLLGILAKQPGTDTMESPGPAERVGHDAGIGAQDLAGDPLDPFGHLGRSAPGERHQQDPARICAADDQVRDTVGKRVRLAGSRSCDDEEWWSDVIVAGDAMLDGSALLWIERLKI